jgi:hypothetical protein
MQAIMNQLRTSLVEHWMIFAKFFEVVSHSNHLVLLDLNFFTKTTKMVTVKCWDWKASSPQCVRIFASYFTYWRFLACITDTVLMVEWREWWNLIDTERYNYGLLIDEFTTSVALIEVGLFFRMKQFLKG